MDSRSSKASICTEKGEIYGLPEGWLVETRKRLSGKTKGSSYKLYYEPGTNKQFRSMKEVKKRLQQEDDQRVPRTPMLADNSEPGPSHVGIRSMGSVFVPPARSELWGKKY